MSIASDPLAGLDRLGRSPLRHMVFVGVGLVPALARTARASNFAIALMDSFLF